jgi:hypothetical protein
MVTVQTHLAAVVVSVDHRCSDSVVDTDRRYYLSLYSDDCTST